MSIIFNEDTSHYQHGIPGIPTDGKVVLLKNSKLKSEVYLVGTDHFSKESAETVKKVIDYVRPNAVAIELCEQRAKKLMDSESKNLTLFEMLCKRMLAPWGLPMKIDMFVEDCCKYQLRANGILSGLEFKVAMEEASRMRARCFLIDDDIDVIHEKMSKAHSWELLWKNLICFENKECTRASLQEDTAKWKKHHPEFFKVLIDDRDRFMFEKIRTIQKKVVVVVGMTHMDGIEFLWNQAEEDMLEEMKNAEEGHNKQPISSKKEKTQ